MTVLVWGILVAVDEIGEVPASVDKQGDRLVSQECHDNSNGDRGYEVVEVVIKRRE